MSFICFVNSLFSTPVSAIQKGALSASVAIAFAVSAQVVFAQESSTNSEAAAAVVNQPQAEQVRPEPRAAEQKTVPASAPHQTSLQQSNSAPQNSANTAAPIGSGRHLMSVTLALMGIVGLIFALSWFVKRFSHGGFTAGSTIKILSTMPLGTRERIVLIDAGGQQLLLGITATNINTLHVFDTPIVVENKTESQSDFSRKLMTILQQKSPLTSMQDSNNKNNSAP